METKGMIGWAIGLYILAAILPGAISSFMGANTTGWTDTVKTIWNLIPLVLVAYVLTRED
jgi:hypothetical protein